jgi:hypothetical protein
MIVIQISAAILRKHLKHVSMMMIISEDTKYKKFNKNAFPFFR